MQAASDVFLGWLRSTTGLDGRRDFYVRQLWDPKASADDREHGPRPSWPTTAGSAAGRSPAPTRARATASPSPAYLGGGDRFDRAIAAFAEAYADQNERDYDALAAAVKAGGIAADSGPELWIRAAGSGTVRRSPYEGVMPGSVG